MKIYFYPLLSALFLVLSCEKYVTDEDYPGFEKELVISAFLSPEDTVYNIKVYENSPVLDYLKNDKEFILTASITDGTKEIQLTKTEEGFKFYPYHLAIEYGKAYHLKIFNKNVLEAEASCTVPFKRDFKLKCDTSTSFNTDISAITCESKLAFTDYKGEKNYYRIFSRTTDYKFLSTGSGQERAIDSITYDNYNDNEVIADYNINEDVITKKLQILTISSGSMEKYEVHFYNISEEYYKYIVSAQKAVSKENNDQNPFVEPEYIYSNVKGGLGIFCTYTKSIITLKIKNNPHFELEGW